jgi:predicted 3-demethylubiquinone-9 3-methyltransferase (glyoxalase superfamily)
VVVQIYNNQSSIKNRMEGKTKKFNYKEQYGVIVICKSENEQKAIFEELKEKGLTLKVVTV